MNGRFPYADASIFQDEDVDDQVEDQVLEQHDGGIFGSEQGEVHALRGGGIHPREQVYVPRHVRARVKPRPLLKVVGGIWRADPSIVLAVDIARPVDPNAEVEILQRHQVVAANPVFRGHLVKLYRGDTGWGWGGGGGVIGGEVGRGATLRERVSHPPPWRWRGALAPAK